MNLLIRCLPSAALLLLAGCNTVQFQSPPSMPLATCAPGWEGDWHVIETSPSADDGPKDEQFLRVGPGCERWWLLGFGVDDAGKPTTEVDDIKEDQELGFASSDKLQVLAIRDRPKSPPEEAPDKPDGYLLIRYEADGKSWQLSQVDRQRAAHLVVDDLAPGWIDKRDRRPDGSSNAYAPEFWVYLFGTPDETRALLDHHELYGAVSHRLEPVDAATSERLSAAIAASPAKEP